MNIQASETFLVSLDYYRDRYKLFIPQEIFIPQERLKLLYREETSSWNKIVRSEERKLSHLGEVAFLSLFTRSASANTLANRARSKYKIINAIISFLSY